MKKFLKRAITAILVATMLLGATMAVGCGDDEDKNTTVIRIMSHGGGYGRVWLDEVCNEFSAMVAEKEYTPGKKGVKFKIESNLETNIALMSTSGYNIYFAGSSLQTKALANKGDIMEIDDIVTTPYTDVNGETYTIESLIEPGFRENLKVNGKYYALPHFSDFPGIAYDAENFAKGGFYFADTTDEDTSKEEVFNSKFGSATFIKPNSNGKKSVGNDGISGTEDDGLPTSAIEFLIMCARMNGRGCKPVQISGQHVYYLLYLIEGLWAGIAGREEMNAVLGGEGTMTVVKTDESMNVKYTNDPLFASMGEYDNIKMPETEVIQINSSNYGRVNDSFAKYVAFSMIEIMEGEGWFSSDSKNPTCDHINAQLGFICNGLSDYEKVGMFCDGTYWYNEANDNLVMEDYEFLTNKKEKQVAYMSMPTSFDKPVTTKAEARELVIWGGGAAGLFLNKRFENDTGAVTACKEFIQYAYSKKELVDRFASSGIYTCGIDFNAAGINESGAKDGLDFYKTSFYKVVTDATFPNVGGNFVEEAFYPTISGKKYTSILTAMRLGISAKTCFENSRSVFGQDVV